MIEKLKSANIPDFPGGHMKLTPFITSNCGNTPEEAFARAHGNAQGPTAGLKHHSSFKFRELPGQAHLVAQKQLELAKPSTGVWCHCLAAGGGEYVFYGFSPEKTREIPK
jgi:hypothetical protein